ncbi:hypothetical protein ENHY17A_50143 [Moraxellaceae bacterium 17A]|nr:hypothetical protein ENHY17A_50143 [Moraxellaceae bacterium 17A]
MMTDCTQVLRSKGRFLFKERKHGETYANQIKIKCRKTNQVSVRVRRTGLQVLFTWGR